MYTETDSKMSKATLIMAVLLFTGCVTVNLGDGGKGQKAKGVEYMEPAAPFAKESRDTVDAAWKNPKNGNVISYLSDCKDPSDPPLDHIVQGVLAGLSEVKVESTESPMIQGREARHVVAAGKVDGVPTGTELIVFKRNMCIYILTYVGVQKYFSENRAAFTQFASGFRAP